MKLSLRNRVKIIKSTLQSQQCKVKVLKEKGPKGKQDRKVKVTKSHPAIMEGVLAKRTGEKCKLNYLICKTVQLMDTDANEDALRDIAGRIQKQLELFTHIHSEYVDLYAQRR